MSRNGRGRSRYSASHMTTMVLVLITTVMVIVNLAIFVRHNHSYIRTKAKSPHSMKSDFKIKGFPQRRQSSKDSVSKENGESIEIASKHEFDVIKTKTIQGNIIYPEPPQELDGVRYHLVFSTDCSAYQHWQSYLLFFSAMKVGQPGHVTRIASGCNEKEAAETTSWHEEHVKRKMSNRFGIHLTPHFSKTDRGSTYKFFNKPMGFLHWLQYGEGTRDENGKLDDDVVVILTDPDMILLRRITNDFNNNWETLMSFPREAPSNKTVVHGRPYAQKYGYGTTWKNRNVEIIAGPNSPANLLPRDSARKYSVGPPYIGTARDMIRIAEKWVEYVPKVYAEFPMLMAEMYAYSIAAADLELEHVQVDSMMVSSLGDKEAWQYVTRIPGKDVCEFAANINPNGAKLYPVPNTLHYCQRYGLDEWFFAKRRLPKDFFTCASPLLKMPPKEVATSYDYWIPPPPHKPKGEKKPLSTKQATQMAFMICGILGAINEAGKFYKQEHCKGVEGTVWEMSMELSKI